MNKKYLIFTAPIVAIVGLSIFAWQFYDTKAKAAKLEAEILKELSTGELRSVLMNHPATAPLLNDAVGRQAFLKGLQEYLALAAEARREGLANDRLFKINFEYKKVLFFADAYDRRQAAVTGKSVPITEEDLKTVWADPLSEAKFRETMDAITEIQQDLETQRGTNLPISALQGEALEKARRNWARAHFLSRKAWVEDRALVESNEMRLRIKILEAGILAADYLRKHYASDLRPTEAEIATYLNAHPEFQEGRKRERAERILERLKSGEDFAAVAKTESEDRSSKDNGGLLEDVPVDNVWGKVEEIVLSLAPGELYPELVETDIGFHIVRLERKSGVAGEKPTKYSFRQILVQRAFEDPNHNIPGVPPPFIDRRSIAFSSIEKEKRDKFVRRVIERAGVLVPEDI